VTTDRMTIDPSDVGKMEDVLHEQDPLLSTGVTPELHLTVGLPRSGKTTWALKTPWPIVCPDAIRLALHGQRWFKEAEPIVWAHAKLMVRSLFRAGHLHVVLDATNNTRKRRDEWRHDAEWRLVFHTFEVDAETCRQRALDTGRPELLEVIDRMAAEHEPLQPGEADDSA